MNFSSEVFNRWGDKYQVTEFRITLSQKLRSWCERLVLHEKKWCSRKRHYCCLFFIEWIEMPVMPDISAHWLAGWRSSEQQLFQHDQSMWNTLLLCNPFVFPHRIQILFFSWIVHDLGAACMLCCGLLGLRCFKGFFFLQH